MFGRSVGRNAMRGELALHEGADWIVLALLAPLTGARRLGDWDPVVPFVRFADCVHHRLIALMPPAWRLSAALRVVLRGGVLGWCGSWWVVWG